MLSSVPFCCRAKSKEEARYLESDIYESARSALSVLVSLSFAIVGDATAATH
jgi:hypothetical protein